MYISKAEREEFKVLSKELLGSSSRWQKLLDSGQTVITTKTVIQNIPATETTEETTKEVEVMDLLNGTRQWHKVWHTPETLKAYLLDLKSKRDAFLEKKRLQEEEAKNKKEAAEQIEKLQEVAGGSAI